MSLCDKIRKIQKFPKEFWGMTKNQGKKITTLITASIIGI